MSMKSLMSITPNVDAWWEKYGKGLSSFGYKKEDVKSMDDIINLRIIYKAINGDIGAKKFIDEKAINMSNKRG